MQDAKEEIRSRLNIEEVIGEYVQLSRAGRSMKGLSPFNDEKTPSFMVSPDKHVWYDFSSNRGGDVFSFIMEIEGLDFRGAMELLAQKAGVDMSQYQSGDRAIGDKKKRLLKLLEVATTYYHQTLAKNPRALEYVFKERGFDKEIVQKFKIGFAPDTRQAAVDFLLKRGFSRTEIQEAGMTNQRGGDLFRSRIMIPLSDGTGQVIGFTGRILGEDKKAPKYLNTPQTLLYDKSRHVFGLHLAKEAIRKNDLAVFVEGNLDVVSSHQVGVTNVVAAAGTALTEQHLKVVKRLTSNITLSFDGDRAGLAATERSIPLGQMLDLDLKIISLPNEVKDPDELIKKDPKLWQEAIAQSQSVMEWLLEAYAKRYDLKTAEGKRHFSSACFHIIQKITNPIEQEHYLRLVADRIETTLEVTTHRFNNMNDKSEETPVKKQPKPVTLDRNIHSQEDAMISLIIIDGSVRPLLVELGQDDIQSTEGWQLVKYLQGTPEANILESLPLALQPLETYVKVGTLRAEARYTSWTSLDRYDETARLIRAIKNETKQRKKQRLMDELREAESSLDVARANLLRQELTNLIKEMRSGKPGK